jgi:glucose-6-phosphate 1-dehydrogenase
MFQNHLLQLLALVAMEAPASFSADAMRNESVKVVQSLRPISPNELVCAQYAGYCDLEGVAAGSITPTYAAMKLYVDNWRWKGVPFYLRSGKALARKTSEISVVFQRPPHLMFKLPEEFRFVPNILSFCIQPNEGIHLRFEAKQPDSDQAMRSVEMEFHYKDSFGDSLPEAYEKLLLDVLEGDASLFSRNDGIEASWQFIDPIIKDWEQAGDTALATYDQGSLGPREADDLLLRDGRAWWLGCEEHA